MAGIKSVKQTTTVRRVYARGTVVFYCHELVFGFAAPKESKGTFKSAPTAGNGTPDR